MESPRLLISSCWPKNLHNLAGIFSTGQKMLFTLNQGSKDFTKNRLASLSEGYFTLGERKFLRCGPRDNNSLDYRCARQLQTEVAFDRFLLANLSRFQASHLLGELMSVRLR